MLLTEWQKDRSNKVLIFTKSVKLLEMLEFHLGKLGQPSRLAQIFGVERSHIGHGFLKLDGTTKQADRGFSFQAESSEIIDIGHGRHAHDR
jgi:hypothetical protein